MRTFEERTELIHKRIAELRKKEQKRNLLIIDVLSAAACLLMIIQIGAYMPIVMEGFPDVDLSGSIGAASMIGGHAWMGYIVIGIFSFFTGVSLTVALYHLHHKK